MFRLTLAQMRRSLGRLVAAGIAIAIGTGFVSATFLASSVLQRGTYDSVTAQLAKSDLIVTTNDDSSWTATQAAAVTAKIDAVPGVTATATDLARSVTVRTDAAGSAMANVVLNSTAPTEQLRTYGIATGRAPSADYEIALPQSLADRLGVTVGGRVTTVDNDVSTYASGDVTDDVVAPGESGPSDELNAPLAWTVVGIVDDPTHAHATEGIPALVSPGGLLRYSPVTRAEAAGETTVVGVPWATQVLVTVSGGTDLSTVMSAVQDADPQLTVMTRDLAAKRAVSSISDGQDIFTAFILGFAGLALVVAALVIANTFQVIVAQRRRTLALLRCTGASGSQLRRSVLLEASILGFVASVVGVLLGTAIVQAALLVADGVETSIPLPRLVSFSVVSILVPILVGTVVTVLACLLPAREATRVPPLAALRPQEPLEVRSRGGVVRLTLSGLLAIGGTLLLLGGLAMAKTSVAAGLVAGIVGGAASFVGIAVAAIFWLPPVSRWLGALVSRSGPAARLAAANAVRNPRRTAATSTALLIGVTLVTMMSVGAASARSSLDQALDSTYPVDAVVALDGVSQRSGADQATATIAKVAGVEAAATVPSLSSVQLHGTVDGQDAGSSADIAGLSVADAARVIHDDGPFRDLRDGELLMNEQTAQVGYDAGGQAVSFVSGDVVHLGSGTGPEVTVVVRHFGGQTSYVTPTTLDRLAAAGVGDGDAQASSVAMPDADGSDAQGSADAATQDMTAGDATSDDAATQGTTASTVQWVTLVAFAPGASPSDVVDQIDEALASVSHWTSSPAAERDFMEQVIDTILAVIVGLLAVAVLIALIGVANTLALSVLERRRESATLRAIGLSKRQLRSMLAIEGTFIAGVGAVLGVVLGLLYGWAGSWIVLNVVGDVHLAVPWRDVAIVIGVAIVAGLVASVAPARSATRTSPVEALAVE